MRFGRNSGSVTPYDPDRQEPAMRCSICTGEKVAGFVDRETGRFISVQLIRDDGDLAEFRRQYAVKGDIRKIY